MKYGKIETVVTSHYVDDVDYYKFHVVSEWRDGSIRTMIFGRDDLPLEESQHQGLQFYLSPHLTGWTSKGDHAHRAALQQHREVLFLVMG